VADQPARRPQLTSGPKTEQRSGVLSGTDGLW
jgi:hypothetical protein